MHELPDDSLADILPVAKKVAIATGATEYNVLQNNGRLAHQVRVRGIYLISAGCRPCSLYVQVANMFSSCDSQTFAGEGPRGRLAIVPTLQGRASKGMFLFPDAQVHAKLLSQLPK